MEKLEPNKPRTNLEQSGVKKARRHQFYAKVFRTRQNHSKPVMQCHQIGRRFFRQFNLDFCKPVSFDGLN